MKQIVNDISIIDKFINNFNFILFFFLGIIGLIAGIYLMVKKNNTNYIKVKAIVESQSKNCFKNSNQSCNTIVSYIVDGVSIKGNILLKQFKKQGDVIEIYYERNNVNNISYNKPSLFNLGLIITIFSIIFLTLTIGINKQKFIFNNII